MHEVHWAPAAPHALLVVPGAHCPAVQHPLVHDVVSHVHVPVTQCSPVPAQLPVWQVPPQPSLAPHAAPLQFGVQPHTPLWPPPPHVSGEAHMLPAQHGWPLPPHVPQSPVPHVTPLAHAAHVAPPCPQAWLLVPD